jgi:hypothetical protein
MYQLQPDTQMGAAATVKRMADNAFIPFAEGNTDYRAYLKWLEAGNTPLPADEPEGTQP